MTSNWHERFAQQSKWTQSIRDYLLKDIPLSANSVVLEIGSGTGVIISEIAAQFNCLSIGIDIDFSSLELSTRNFSNVALLQADANSTALNQNSFDLVFCHYFLMWLAHPEIAVQEILRLLKPGGYFIVFAEPDYHSRIDHPAPLVKLGTMQTKALARQAADVGIGRKLPQLLLQVGLNLVKFGSIGYEKPKPGIPPWWETEWQMIKHDLDSINSTQDLSPYIEIDRQSWLKGDRLLYVPTYYAVACKPIN